MCWSSLVADLSLEVDCVLATAREPSLLPSTRRMDHRQPGRLGIGVHGLSDPAQGGSGEEGYDANGRGQGVPPQDDGAHQLWGPRASYFRVVGWGYYWVTVMDDYPRSIRPDQAVERQRPRLCLKSRVPLVCRRRHEIETT